MKRKKKSDIKIVQEKLWQECRRITMNRYNEPHKCFTCNKPITGSNRQLGHFIANSVGGALLRYNLDNLRLQCYYCNINCGGQGAVFYKNLLEEKGQAHIDKLFQLKGQTCKAMEHYSELLTQYQKM